MDFKALRARFQDEELLLKQPRSKPALPEKPKVVLPSSPAPQSPTHYLPAGARPSLLTSINQTLEGKTAVAPRVVFKEEKEQAKKPLLQNKKEKSEGKLKKGKDKPPKGNEKLEEDLKQKSAKDKKVSTAELVPDVPPPKATTGRKGFLGFRKPKRDSAEVQANPILDTPTSDNPGQTPLVPVPPDSGDAPQETSTPKSLLPNIPSVPDGCLVEVAPPPSIPDCPEFIPPPAFIPDNPTPVSESALPEDTASLPLPIPAHQSESVPSPPSTVSIPPPSQTVSGSPAVGFPSSPSPAQVEPAADVVSIEEVEVPPPPVVDPPSVPSSPPAARPISALSALERATDMNPGKKTPPCDLRIFTALEKARSKSSRYPPEEEGLCRHFVPLHQHPFLLLLFQPAKQLLYFLLLPTFRRPHLSYPEPHQLSPRFSTH